MHEKVILNLLFFCVCIAMHSLRKTSVCSPHVNRMWKVIWETLKCTKILKNNKEEETFNTKFFPTLAQSPKKIQHRIEEFDLRCNWELNRR
jgi:hypothetical protein